MGHLNHNHTNAHNLKDHLDYLSDRHNKFLFCLLYQPNIYGKLDIFHPTLIRHFLVAVFITMGICKTEVLKKVIRIKFKKAICFDFILFSNKKILELLKRKKNVMTWYRLGFCPTWASTNWVEFIRQQLSFFLPRYRQF